MAEVLFKKVDYPLKKLIEDISIGEIGLPDIQRPFVWPRTRVRDLFDSMYRGYPVGYLLFWENGLSGNHRSIGSEGKQKAPHLLVVDGQQRLTSLYAVMRSKPLVNKHYEEMVIRIAFNPLKGQFEVATPMLKNDPEWIPDISVLWQPGFNEFIFISEFLERLGAHRALIDEERKKIANAISDLINLENYPFTALEISSSVNEEQVAEIFVRINSSGTPLNQADFILTLMSVFWDDGRKQLEEFCSAATVPPSNNTPSPFNHYIKPTPDQLLRVAVALGFRRARLEYVYSLLRGKDLQTNEFSEERRVQQFQVLSESQEYVLNLQNWHDFLKVIRRSGYVNSQLITSEMAVLYTHALWLIGKRDFRVDDHTLRGVMARWFFMASLTGRYTTSPESQMEQDLALLRHLDTASEFVRALEYEIDTVLTNDFWTITLPNLLAVSSARSPAQHAFFAAQSLLDAPVLYSEMKVSDLLDPSMKPVKKALERHHLFPRRYLTARGVDDRLINRVANFALVEWTDNIEISDKAPAAYVPSFEKRFTPDKLQAMYRLNALPENWYEMDYEEFLAVRQRLMAEIIREGFLMLKKQPSEETVSSIS